MMLVFLCFVNMLACSYAFTSHPSPFLHHKTIRNSPVLQINFRQKSFLQMITYSSKQGVPSALIEERDACGVGFIASLNKISSHSIVKQALDACSCMEHRGASSADNISGDGAGILTSIPWEIFEAYVYPLSSKNRDGSSSTAVGMIFLPRDDSERSEAIAMVEKVLKERGFLLVAWRSVPVDMTVLGALSKDFVPRIKQIIVQRDTSPLADSREFEKALYETRRGIQGLFRKFQLSDAYVCSLSGRTIVYKGMLRSEDLPRFYPDLRDPRYKSDFASYHRRFSTNTVPKWYLAQPMRMLAHNGEINTLLGNINWVKSRQLALRREGASKSSSKESASKDGTDLSATEKRVVKGPLVDVSRSDSANLDSILENFVTCGRSPEEALMVLVPEAYRSQPRYNIPKTSETSEAEDITSFYAYHESMQEAWDGPALLVFSDGLSVGAGLDRNGLRPARYMVTRNAYNGEEVVHVMSEVGVTRALPLFGDCRDSDCTQVTNPEMTLVHSGRLGPGEILSVVLKEGKLRLNDEVKAMVARKQPYKQWVADTIVSMPKSSSRLDIKSFINSYVEDPANRELSLSIDAESEIKPIASELDNPSLISTQTLFGWGTEDVEVQISSMAADAIEATYCMGDDAPLAVLSSLPHTLYDYFKQRFAQVTNPPIDPLREGAVMSLTMYLGPRGGVTDPSPGPQSGVRVKIDSPILTSEDLENLSHVPHVSLKTVSTLYPLIHGLTAGGLEESIDALCNTVIQLVKDGATVINLSDELAAYSTVSSTYDGMTYIPPLLAIGAVHHSLIENGLRTKVSLTITTGSAWSTHHIACLIAYGASAVVPYAAYHAVLNWHSQKRTLLAIQRGDLSPSLTPSKALYNYRKALDKGLLKILSKMGISLLTSYHGAQIFEIIGFDDRLISKAFRGTPCRVTGMSFDEIAAETAEFSRRAYGVTPSLTGIIENIEKNTKSAEEITKTIEENTKNIESSTKNNEGNTKKLFNYGFLNYLKTGEYHHNNQPLIKMLHGSIRNHNVSLYEMYSESVALRPVTTLRDTLDFARDSTSNGKRRVSLSLDRVESAESIVKRFCTGGMSLGALSREAHETLAVAMNRLGGRSNSGEGGEDPVRMGTIQDVVTSADDTVSSTVSSTGVSAKFPHLKGLRNGDSASSKIKQVASGRFGVTPQYLMSAEQIEIKIAQGAKPGEGGQLPGGKVDAYIAGLRSSKPGVTLISPPPHHDIYSIEDLAQLIYDMHQINPNAAVSVKLVSEVGIGTVAAGVAKAGADVIQISGHDGGTGASPASSIKHAGSPWELGLVEAHSALRRSGLRDRVLLRVDGGLKTGWDVVMAAAMGAEEFGFGTIAMIAEGCIMARICHTNKCPVGVTTQNEALRKRFPGTPDNIVTFFGYVAEEVRQILAELGYSSLDEIIGKPGLLIPRPSEQLNLRKTNSLDASFIMDSLSCDPLPNENMCEVDEDRSWLKHGPVHTNGRTLDDIILEDTEVAEAITTHGSASKAYHIKNTDRASFARISGRLASHYGDKGFKGKLRFDVTGAAGQSFCAFLSHGMEVSLVGYANDYVCKGMAGGKVSISPPPLPIQAEDAGAGKWQSSGSSSDAYSVTGNTLLYGATGGRLFVNGRAGERFAVRNSGADSVVEGLGDHGCEYMTAGNVICLGSTGRNFGAGMTGGLAFVLDDETWLSSSDSDKLQLPFAEFVNNETVTLQRLNTNNSSAKRYLQEVLEEHVKATGSKRGLKVLQNIDEAIDRIWVVVPNSEKSNALLKQDAIIKTSEEISA